MKHLISQPHIIFSVENSKYPDKVEIPLKHEDALEFLNQNTSGKNVYSLEGYYGKPEKSILIVNPSDEQKEAARALTHLTGQDSHIESDGYTHKMIYSHGPNSGKVVIGRGTTFHESKPKDMYSVLPDGTVFTHNFDFENSHVIIQKNSMLEKAKEEEWMSPEAKRSFRSERKKFSPQDPLASQLTSDRGVSETGIEARRADSRISGARAHGYARVSSPEFHAKRAKTYARETLEDLRSQPKPNLPKSEKPKPKFEPLMKPYVSEAQRRWAHTPAGMKALGGKKAVEHWDEESKGKDLPEKIEKALSPEELQDQGYRFKMRSNHPFKKSLQNPSPPSAPKVNINPEHGKIIADAYHNMKHDPHHPEVKAAYEALINETKKQFKDMLDQGFKFTKIKPNQENPYKTSRDLHNDIKQNKHLYFFPTEQGFGSGDKQVSDHPMLQPTEFMHEGKPLLANDIFRIVHDYRGHHLGGESTFGPKGEHQAYLTHKKDFSPLAQKALATETLMQNSWVNFGPYGEHNRKNPHQTIYAEQKAAIAPDWIVNGRWHE